MSKRPVFVATHPRACSTAFERVFMTCRDTLQAVHEPFGDPWYYGPERLCDRFENDEKARQESGYANTTYRDVFEKIDKDNAQGKRLFIKDMAQYWMPTEGKPASIAPSLVSYRRGVGTNGETNEAVNGHDGSNGHLNLDVAPAKGAKPVQKDGYPYSTASEPGNPTVIPEALLKQFHFTFLIRHPRSSIPSYFRCTIPPLNDMTGWNYFDPKEAGYAELRALFDYLRKVGQVGPRIAGQAHSKTNGINGVKNGTNGVHNGTNGVHSGTNGVQNGTNGVENGADDQVEICLIDADDMLDDPYAMIEKYCSSIGVEYSPDMLKWNGPGDLEHAQEQFEKWKGWHEDALDSDELRPRTHKKTPKSDEQLYKEWTEKFGEDAAKLIKKTVEDNVEHYEYLKQFAIKI